MDKTPNNKDTAQADRLGSDDLAALIIDALLRANIIKDGDVERAVKIATEEIEVRKALGDF